MPASPKPSHLTQGSGNALVASRAITKNDSSLPNQQPPSNDPPVVISPRTGKPKRRKATRACIHCQRTHLTCDNDRPCERCVARGLAATCRDGVRKKAKYLSDVPDSVAQSDESLKFDPRYNKKAQPKKPKARQKPAANDAKSDQDYSGNHSFQNGQAVHQPQNSQISSQPFALPLMIPSTINTSLSSNMDRSRPNSSIIQGSSIIENYGVPESLLNINTASTSPFNSLLTTLPNPLHQLRQDERSNSNEKNTTSTNNSKNNLDTTNTNNDHSTNSLVPPLEQSMLNTGHSNLDILQYLHSGNADQQDLNDSNSLLSNLQLSRHNFQSLAVNMEYSVISNIINTASPKTGLDIGKTYSPSLSSTGDDSPSFFSSLSGDVYNGNAHVAGNSKPKSVSDNDVFKLDNLNQYALGIHYRIPSSIAGILHEMSPLRFDDEIISNQAQSLPEITEMIEALKQVQYNQRQQQALETGTQLWMIPESPGGPKRPLSFTISTKTRTPQNSPASTPLGQGIMGVGVGSGTGMSAGSGLDRTSYGGTSDQDSWMFRKFSEPAEIYANVRQPYSYTPAYHQLTIYIRTRFTREQQLRIAKSMASYRPSFIACTNTLKEDDLIFMEQCFQRTLLEYEKFMAYSGTPTAVWRRTGQISAVGTEFCVLTGWPRERLLNEHTFIVELMDDNSVVEYFEMFSKMAFGDSRGVNMSECTLLTPQGKKVKTTSIWTLKRDVFGIPMMIVGNFLPIIN